MGILTPVVSEEVVDIDLGETTGVVGYEMVITIKKCPILHAENFTYFILSDAVLNNPRTVEFSATALDGSLLVFSGSKKVQWTYKGIDTRVPIVNLAGGSYRIVKKNADSSLADFIRQVYQLDTIRYLSQYPTNVQGIELLTFPTLARFDIRKIEGRSGNFIEVHGDEDIEDLSLFQWGKNTGSWSEIYRGPNNTKVPFNGKGNLNILIQPYTHGILDPSYKVKSLNFSQDEHVVNFKIMKTGKNTFKVYTVGEMLPDFDTFTINGTLDDTTYLASMLSTPWISDEFIGSESIEIIQQKDGAYLRSQILDIPKSYIKSSTLGFISDSEDSLAIFNITVQSEKLHIGMHSALSTDASELNLPNLQKLVYKLMIIEHSTSGTKLHKLWPLQFKQNSPSPIGLHLPDPVFNATVASNEVHTVEYSKNAFNASSVYEFKVLEWTVGLELSRIEQEATGITFTDSSNNSQTTSINLWETQHPMAVYDNICPPNDLKKLFLGIPKSLYTTGAIPGTFLLFSKTDTQQVGYTHILAEAQDLKALHSIQENGRIETILARIQVHGHIMYDEVNIWSHFGDEDWTLLNSYSGLSTIKIPHLFKVEDLSSDNPSLNYKVQYYKEEIQQEIDIISYDQNTISEVLNSINSHNSLLGGSNE